MIPYDQNQAHSSENANLPAVGPGTVLNTHASGVFLPANPERPPALSAPPDLLGLLKALRRRWVLALFGGLVLSLSATGAAYLLVPRPKFTARALLQVASLRPRVIFNTSENITEYRIYQRTQLTLAKSRMVLNAALRNPEVAKLAVLRELVDPVAWLDKEIKADFPGGAEVLSVSMSGTRPQELMVLVNAVNDAYVKQIVEEEQRERVVRFDRLKTLFNRYQDELRDKRKTYRELAETVGSNDKQSVAMKQQMAMEHMAAARQGLTQLQADLRKTKLNVKMIGSRTEASVRPPTLEEQVDAMLDKDPPALQLTERLTKLQVQLQNIQRLVRSRADPSIKRVSDAVALARKALVDRRRQIHDDLVAQFQREGRTAPKTELQQVQEYAQFLTQQEKELRDEIGTLDSEMRSFNVKSIDLHWIEDEIELTTNAARTIGTEVESLNVELQAPPRIRQIEKAELPKLTDANTKHLKVSGLVGLGTFALFIGGVSYWEFNARRIDTVEQIVQGLRMRLLGVIPAMPQGRKKGPVDAWQRLLIDSVDATRMMLLHASRSHSFRTVMVTSALKGEGKTTLSSHLATSLARAGKRTLLVDCDLRNPSTHKILDVPTGLGICEYLRGEATLEEIIQQTPSPDLAWIRAGQCDTVALQALARDGLRPLFEALQGFDFVIVDTAPVLLVTDSLVISQYVDAAVFSILREVSRIPKVYAAYERLESLGVRMLGAVVAGTRSEHSSYNYGYGYGYGYGSVAKKAEGASTNGAANEA